MLSPTILFAGTHCACPRLVTSHRQLTHRIPSHGGAPARLGPNHPPSPTHTHTHTQDMARSDKKQLDSQDRLNIIQNTIFRGNERMDAFKLQMNWNQVCANEL